MDERGRIFGKVNLIDALVLVFCCWMIPLAYGAYTLFRMPPVVVFSLEPKQIIVGHETRVTVHGDQLNPYLRARLNTELVTYRHERQDRAELALSDKLPVGTYTLSLLDEANTVAVLPDAIQIVPPPVAPEPLAARPLIRYRPQWLTQRLPWATAQAHLNTIEREGWELYTLMPCADKLCVVARKPIYQPTVRR